MLDDQSRSDTYPYIDIQEDDTTMTHEATVGKISADQVFYLMSRGLTENEAHEPHRAGLPRGVHQGAPDGVRDRVQPARQAGDGGVARMTEVAEPSSARRARPRAGDPPRARRTCRSRSSTAPSSSASPTRAASPTGCATTASPRSRRSSRCRSRATGCTRRTWTCAPRRSTGSRPTCRRPSTAPTAGRRSRGSRRAHRAARGRRRRAARSTRGRARAGVRLLDARGARRRRDEALARERSSRARRSLPADEKLAQLSRAAWTHGVVVHVPAGVRVERPDRAPLGARRPAGARRRAR